MKELFRRFSSGSSLYPDIEPFDKFMLPVGSGHQLYVEQCGSPQGLPVIVLHGGPGGGCSPGMRRFFDPQAYRIVLFDQRGCGKSTPTAGVEANTTQHLISDIELICQTLGIKRCILFGGSWGTALALLYAQAHPERVIHVVLRAVFLMTRRELNWFYGGGAARFWPDQWEALVGPIPENERGSLIAAYHRRLFSGDRSEEMRFGGLWLAWETALCKLSNHTVAGARSSGYARTFARLGTHYFVNGGFLPKDGHILDHIHLLAEIPGTIIHGRFDVVCPLEAAWELSKAWPRSKLEIVPAAHAHSEPSIQERLVATMNGLRGVKL